MKNLKTALAAAILTIGFQPTFSAQENNEKPSFPYSNRVSVLAGLIQPFVLKGGNIEVTYFTKKLSFDYSHGFLLNMSDGTITGAAKEQGLAYHLPYSTGFGIGYRFTAFFDVRIEPKMHSWEVYYNGETQNAANRIQSYKTYTVGLGAYYRYMPFRKKDNWLQGITTSSSVRWWPNIATSLSDDRFTYQHKFTGKEETLKASNIGVAGSQFLINVSIGYTFGGK